MVRVWPSARKSKLLSAALKVRTIEPEPEPALTIVAESAPASAAAWFGGVAPPDQSIEDTLVVTSLTLKPVKVSTPGDAVDRKSVVRERVETRRAGGSVGGEW